MKYLTTNWVGLFGGKLISRKWAIQYGIPHHYGVAYYRRDLSAMMIYPKPLHLIVRWWHWLDDWRILLFGQFFLVVGDFDE